MRSGVKNFRRNGIRVLYTTPSIPIHPSQCNINEPDFLPNKSDYTHLSIAKKKKKKCLLKLAKNQFQPLFSNIYLAGVVYHTQTHKNTNSNTRAYLFEHKHMH